MLKNEGLKKDGGRRMRDEEEYVINEVRKERRGQRREGERRHDKEGMRKNGGGRIRQRRKKW